MQSVRFAVMNSRAEGIVQNLVWILGGKGSQVDAMVVRIGQVDGFVHAVVRGTQIAVCIAAIPNRSPERQISGVAPSFRTHWRSET